MQTYRESIECEVQPRFLSWDSRLCGKRLVDTQTHRRTDTQTHRRTCEGEQGAATGVCEKKRGGAVRAPSLQFH